MRKLGENKTLVIVWIISIVIIIVSMVVFSSKDIVIYSMSLLLSNIIQSIAVITLVLITWFYATQTQKLVEQEKISLEEEKKKRYAYFGEKRIEDFYNPLLVELGKLQGVLEGPSIDTSKVRRYKMQILEIGFKNIHMGSTKCGELLGKLDDELEEALEKGTFRHEERTKIKEEIKKAAKLICNETEKIGNKIKDISGYFNYETEDE